MTQLTQRAGQILAAAVGLMAACQQAPIATSDPLIGPTRTVEHSMGIAQVPVAPQRVVVLDTAPLDAVIALGVEPVGTIVYGSTPAYLGAAADTIAVVGDGNKPDLEAVLALDPDLILGSKIGTDKIYPRLIQIAPTVLAAGSGRAGNWQTHFRLYAQALGKSEQAEELLQNYQDRAQTLRQALVAPQNIEISVLSPYEGQISAYTTGSFSGSVLADVGLSRTPAQDLPEEYAIQLSREALPQLEGDFIFLVYSDYFPGSIQTEDFAADPVWSQLKAVQSDRVCQVSAEVWLAGRSLLAAQQILSDIEQCIDLNNL
ncbi:MAG: iron-siderophore ABC transporter substrate-binding protein [Cyanobacteria bacterium P01_C01_bin.73]